MKPRYRLQDGRPILVDPTAAKAAFAGALGRRLKHWRQLKRVGAADLAARIGVSRNTVWNIERGNVVPDLHTTLQFCREIDVPIEALLSEVLA